MINLDTFETKLIENLSKVHLSFKVQIQNTKYPSFKPNVILQFIESLVQPLAWKCLILAFPLG